MKTSTKHLKSLEAWNSDKHQADIRVKLLNDFLKSIAK
jgi:hypothetical protein